jgi:hypothetical protein
VCPPDNLKANSFAGKLDDISVVAALCRKSEGRTNHPEKE